MFSTENGDRPEVRNVAFLFTDGESDDRNATWRMAAAAREAGIHIIIVGINLRDELRQLELLGIGSDPNDKNVFNFDSFEDFFTHGLDNVLPQLLEAACNSK